LYIYLPLLLLSLDVSFVSWLVPPTFSRSFDFPSSFDFPFETIPPPADGWMEQSERLIFFFSSSPFSDAPDARVIRFFLLPLTRQPTTTTTTFEGGNEINQTAMHLHFLNPTGTYSNSPAACVIVSAVLRRRSGRHHPANVVVRRRVCHKQQKNRSTFPFTSRNRMSNQMEYSPRPYSSFLCSARVSSFFVVSSES
jgi:hypothetical protein